MLISIALIALAISIFLGLFLISRSIKMLSKSINLYLGIENEDILEEDDEKFIEEDLSFSDIDDNTMFFVFDDSDNMLSFFKLSNLSADSLLIGEHKGHFYLDLSKVSFEEEEKYRAIAIECLGCEIRNNEIANQLKDWLNTR